MEIIDNGEFRFIIEWKGYSSKNWSNQHANSLHSKYLYIQNGCECIQVRPTEDNTKSEFIVHIENDVYQTQTEATEFFNFLKQCNNIKRIELFNTQSTSEWMEGLGHYNMPLDEYVLIYTRMPSKEESDIMRQITCDHEFVYLGEKQIVTQISCIHDCIIDEPSKGYQAFAKLDIAGVTLKFRLYGNYERCNGQPEICKSIYIDKKWEICEK